MNILNSYRFVKYSNISLKKNLLTPTKIIPQKLHFTIYFPTFKLIKKNPISTHIQHTSTHPPQRPIVRLTPKLSILSGSAFLPAFFHSNSRLGSFLVLGQDPQSPHSSPLPPRLPLPSRWPYLPLAGPRCPPLAPSRVPSFGVATPPFFRPQTHTRAQKSEPN